ncbi:conserved protein of unknown function [Hyphomicrobium sp. 1Nfss2.1]|uniref:hypothetical protein n=1 Tax=Hyphomicrobium sp. 1Nfss2.1 TaxID=3413936 RepID=UPI003C7BBC49
MSSSKIEEARMEAIGILALAPEEVSRVFYEEMQKRKLGKLVLHLDQLMLHGGEDAELAGQALKRLGFGVV